MNFLERILELEFLRSIVKKMPTVKQLVFGVVGILALSYLFLILLSYNPADPAWSQVSSEATVTNIGGALGAWISDILRTFFGWSSWLFVGFSP